MIRISLFIGLLFMSLNLSAQEVPKINKTGFSKEALDQKITSSDGKKTTVDAVLKKHEGGIVVIDFWASWCRDCILALPTTKILKENNTELDFVYFSLDRSHEQWKKGLEKHDLANNENYWFDEGWKNNFNNYIDLNWVPRFIVVDQTGKIAKYYAISPADPDVQKTIDQLKTLN